MYVYGLGNLHDRLHGCKLLPRNCSLGACGFDWLCQEIPASYCLGSNAASSFINLKYVMCFNCNTTTALHHHHHHATIIISLSS